MIRSTSTRAAALLLAVLVAGCAAPSGPPAADGRRLSSERSEHLDSKASDARSSESRRPRSSACSTSGCRETPTGGTLLEAATGFGSKPPAATDVAWTRLTFWGFDARRHTGELLVHRTVADGIVSVFRTLYRQRFPQEQVGIVRSYDPDAPATGDGNGTGSFVCRPSTGASYFSQHAYGLADPARHDRRGRTRHRCVRQHRLGVGRRLERVEGQPALQPERPVTPQG